MRNTKIKSKKFSRKVALLSTILRSQAMMILQKIYSIFDKISKSMLTEENYIHVYPNKMFYIE
jgi:hypothetical protein